VKKAFEALGRLQLQAVLLLACVFLIGGLTGAAIERAREQRGGPPGRGAQQPGGLPPEISRRLNLTAEQTKEIQAVLDRHKPATDSVMGEFLPRLRSVTDSVRAEIRSILTPAQRKLFDREPPRLLEDQGRSPMGGGPHPGPGPGGPPGPPPGGPGDRPPDGPGAPPPQGAPPGVGPGR
jgi:hypothetical protein